MFKKILYVWVTALLFSGIVCGLGGVECTESALSEASGYLEEAHRIYAAGLDNYGTGYLLDSRENAQKAYEIYKRCNRSDRIYAAGRLVEKIEEDILDLEELAKMLYNEGEEAYAHGNYDNYRAALNNFQKCSVYYEILNKSLEKKQCDDMTDATLNVLWTVWPPNPNTEEEAQQKYIKAGYSRNYGDWDNCINSASEAKSIYNVLYEIKWAEKDVNEARRYEQEIAKCDKLIPSRRPLSGGAGGLQRR